MRQRPVRRAAIPDQGPDPATTDVRAAARGVLVAVLAGLPVFYTGALAVQLRGDLGFGVGGLGGLVATYFVTTAALSVPMGRAVERLGAPVATAAGATVGAVAPVSAAAADSWAHLVGALAVAGAGNALTQPAANLLISDSVPVRRLGLAFGVKQSCVPAGALLGGIAVPTVGLVLGWRWAFGLTAAVAGCYAVWLWLSVGRPRTGRTPRRTRTPLRASEAPLATLVMLTAGGFLGAAATTSLGTFLVDAAVAGGFGPGVAGWLYAGLAAGTILARVALGWTLDRDPTRSRFVVIAALLTTGAAGYGLMALGQRASGDLSWFVAGAVLGYVLGWGWTGLFHYAIVTWYRRSAAAATGVIQTGLSLGAGLGPLAFGLVVATAGYPAAWAVAGATSLAAALIIDLARRRLRALRRRSAGPVDRFSHPDPSRRRPMAEEGPVPGTPAVSDTMDALGLTCGVPPDLQAVGPTVGAVAGPARTARVVRTDEPGIPGLAEVLDDLAAGTVLVLGWDTGEQASVWGGLAATRTAAAGCVALVTDGFVRDVEEVAPLPLAVRARGTTPRSGKGRLAVTDVGAAVSLGGVQVADGDLVVVDATGVCVCPADHAAEVLAGALELETRDEVFRRALGEGAGFGAARTAAGTM